MVARRKFLRGASLGLLAQWAGRAAVSGARPVFAQGATAQTDQEPAPIKASERIARVLAPVRDGRRLLA
jgi:hypothetical protein